MNRVFQRIRQSAPKKTKGRASTAAGRIVSGVHASTHRARRTGPEWGRKK